MLYEEWYFKQMKRRPTLAPKPSKFRSIRRGISPAFLYRLSQTNPHLAPNMLESIVQSMSDGVIVANEKGKFLLWNKAAERIVGLTSTQIPAEQWSSFYGIFDPGSNNPFPVEKLPLVRAIQGEASDNTEMIIRNSKVSEGVHISSSGRPLRDAAGKIIGGVVVFRDITEQKRQERRLIVQHAITRILTECNTLDEAVPRVLEVIGHSLIWDISILWLADPTDYMLHCAGFWHAPDFNASEFESVTRRRSVPAGIGLPGRVWASRQPQWLSELTADLGFPRLSIAFREGLRSGFGFPIVLSGQALGVIECYSRQLRQSDDDLMSVMANVGSHIAQFIERKRTEKALNESRERFQAILDNTTAVIYLKDCNGRYMFINRQYEKLFHVTREAILGKTTYDMFPKRVADALVANDKKVMETQIPLEIEEAVPQDGGLHTYFTIKFPLRDAQGKLYAICGISTDITLRREMEQNLLKKTADLARARAEREQLELMAFVVTHDLREPLQKIIGFGQLLDESCGKSLKEQEAKFLDRMLGATRRMNILLDDIVKFTRISLVDKVNTPVSLEGILREVVSELELKIVESGAQINVGSLPTIDADPGQMRQLFKNLISNAIKFRKKDVPLQVDIQTQGSDNGHIQIGVSDNGIGFSCEHTERIFKPFERLETSVHLPGTGIGLAICKKIVLRHGGKITAQGFPGKGATFTIDLPIASPS